MILIALSLLVIVVWSIVSVLVAIGPLTANGRVVLPVDVNHSDAVKHFTPPVSTLTSVTAYGATSICTHSREE